MHFMKISWKGNTTKLVDRRMCLHQTKQWSMNTSTATTTRSCMPTSACLLFWASFSCCWWTRLAAPMCIPLMVSDPETARPISSKITTTLGLVVHAAADGVALGAAASTSQTSVQLIVFVAIMLHKAPAAFGLVSFLMHAGLERNRIRKHLLVFALAAPVMSMVTFLGLSKSSKEALSEVNATGVAMLFSAGTFLYVATVHVLPEVGGIGHSHKADSTGGRGLSRLEVAALVLGCLIPLILSIGHQH
ncbi:zinc transporter ZIP9 isoform X2 [Perognathus longimembris pacificus]|uniref:zinc transporter ZIP9 isoform X2 n=1 Tax=Perognathus longimembris pacificus TaxID=214514 RepID=UPI0020198E28|nr:zinc transporter ZIP9 isoform X2 [Perognathus longimembris pacificus]XP_048218818.1 zinc transporter ZIP9 isoform X2 [Perognathus longimembris pacificus]